MPIPHISRFIDPFTDFGFKKIFGTEPNKDLLIDLLNSIFNGRKVIADLEYNKDEHRGESDDDGAAIFDLTCTGQDGEKFIIEVQRGQQAHFKKRAIFYTSLMATGLAPRGNRAGWAYNMPEIYFIGLLENFSVADENDGQYLRDICLTDRNTGKVFYDGLGYIFLELGNFVKAESELESTLDNWLYVLKNMSQMNMIPVFTRKTIFEKLFSIAEYTKLSKEEKDMYNTALKHKWDAQNKLDYAWETGKKEGLQEGEKKDLQEGLQKGLLEGERKALAEKKQIAAGLKSMGVPVKDIAQIVGLSIEDIEKL